jgi:predicted AlkP superfamily phosphohydrolase/phosphomutase
VTYRALDRVVGRVRKRLRPGDLVLKKTPAAGSLGHIDWSKTRAYGLGLNGLYVNLRGRERQQLRRVGGRTSLRPLLLELRG